MWNNKLLKKFLAIALVLYIALLNVLDTNVFAATNTINTVKNVILNDDKLNNQNQKKVKWCIIGDSISDHKQYGEHDKLYMDYIEENNCIDLTNLAIRGTGFMSYSRVLSRLTKGESLPYTKVIYEMPKDTEVLTIFSSFNDIAVYDTYPYEIGTIYDRREDTLYGALNLVLERAKKINPNVKIGITTPLKWIAYEFDQIKKPQCQQYVNVIKNWANFYSIPVLDLYEDANTFGYNLYDTSNYINHDGTHIKPNIHLGYMVPRIVGFLKILDPVSFMSLGVLEKDIQLLDSYEFAEFSEIKSGMAKLYVNQLGVHSTVVVAINAGHGTLGGEKKKTYSHPDKTPKLITGTTKEGEVYSTAISSGTSFLDGTTEADVVLKLANAMLYELLKKGYSVLMLRDTADVQLDNVARTVIANNNASAHISLHYNSTTTDNGIFYIGVPDIPSYTNMYPVSTHYMYSNRMGQSLMESLRAQGEKIYNKDGRIDIDLTQISYSTIRTLDLELGDRASDHSEYRISSLAAKLANAIDNYFINDFYLY